MMEMKPALALPDGVEIIGLERIDRVLTITVVSTQMHPRCLLCGGAATRVHSRYIRQIADLPCSGQQVRPLVQVRKCFCDVITCARKIFAERLTPFVDAFARVTQRLYQIVQVIGLATGGRLGVRVTDRLGIQTSRQTILRRIMALPREPIGQIVQLGIDDFSFRRGRKFGTILVNLQKRQVIDVLPDRKAETSATWMACHPEIELVSRDRGGDYAYLVRRLPEGKKNASKGAELSPAPLPSRQATFLFLARPEKLDAEEQEAVRLNSKIYIQVANDSLLACATRPRGYWR